MQTQQNHFFTLYKCYRVQIWKFPSLTLLGPNLCSMKPWSCTSWSLWFRLSLTSPFQRFRSPHFQFRNKLRKKLGHLVRNLCDRKSNLITQQCWSYHVAQSKFRTETGGMPKCWRWKGSKLEKSRCKFQLQRWKSRTLRNPNESERCLKYGRRNLGDFRKKFDSQKSSPDSIWLNVMVQVSAVVLVEGYSAFWM